MKRIILICSFLLSFWSQAFASTPLDIKIEWKFVADGNNNRYGILRFVPQVDGFEEYFSQISGIGLGVDDEPNEYFLTTEDAEDYYLQDSHWINQVVTNMNMDTGVTDYVFRDLIRVPGHVNDEDKLIRASVSSVNGRLAIAEKMYVGTVAKTGAFPISKSATASGGSAVFYLTSNGQSNGAALFPNGHPYLESLSLRAEDSTTPHSFGVPELSNSNKTLTVSVTKIAVDQGLVTLGATANGSTINATIFGD